MFQCFKSVVKPSIWNLKQFVILKTVISNESFNYISDCPNNLILLVFKVSLCMINIKYNFDKNADTM